MQSQRASTLADDSLVEDPPIRPDLRVVTTTRSPRLFRTLGVVIAALVAAGGYVHFCLYRHGYRAIPKIGVGFLAQVVVSAIVVAALLVGPHRVARLSHLTDRLAGTVTGLAAAALAAGTLTAFALTRTQAGLFNFRERGLQPAPQALIALLAEIGVLVALGVWLVADHVLQRQARMVRAPPV